jgi:DNA-binding MarR family transcriptional regulator
VRVGTSFERKRYRARSASPDRSGRRYHLALTDRGRAVNSMRGGTVEAELEAALADLTPAQLAAAEYALESIGLRLSETGRWRR